MLAPVTKMKRWNLVTCHSFDLFSCSFNTEIYVLHAKKNLPETDCCLFHCHCSLPNGNTNLLSPVYRSSIDIGIELTYVSCRYRLQDDAESMDHNEGNKGAHFDLTHPRLPPRIVRVLLVHHGGGCRGSTKIQIPESESGKRSVFDFHKRK